MTMIAYPRRQHSISAPYGRRRRHAHCAGVGVPVLKSTASEWMCHTRTMGMPSATPICSYGDGQWGMIAYRAAQHDYVAFRLRSRNVVEHIFSVFGDDPGG